MPRTEEQYEELRNERKNLIMDVALKLFAENGYHNTSINQIAKQAKISKGLLYNYFESKETLLSEIMMKFLQTTYHEFDPNKDGILTKDEFEYFIHFSLQQAKEKTLEYKLYFALSTQPNVFSILEKSFLIDNPKYKLIMKELYDYFERNNFPNPVAEITVLTSMLKGVILQYVYAPKSINLDFVKERILQMYCHDKII